ncbi:hypothetical protein [Shewanella baltica]|uniref:hypothetical protein n=1 Tax=Shewanella baltica TaxID=62322 RepID=UPI00217F0780|nr:hypothetical protein [Shewanella baltica]MCS6102354.1 hypothetical protein [Shewanella baltica]MCS6185542.1 hypothetical protein [Shewanella baltica]
MGSSSRSASSQTTNNTSTTFGIQGANNGLVINGSGNTVTDGGAFDIVSNIADMFPQLFSQGAGMVSDGFNAVTDVAMMGERQNESFLNAAVDLFGETNSAQQDMFRVGANALTEFGDLQSRSYETYTNATRDNLSDSLKFADGAVAINAAVSQASMDNSKSLATTVADALARANENNTYLAGTAMTNSADLAESLTKTALDSGNQANKDATSQLQRGFDSMMGFAEQFSRSDGAALAESNNKTMLYMLGGTALVAGAVMFMGRK